MVARFSISDQKGFTLIELISVMVILAMFISVAIKKYDLLSNTASQRVLWDSVKELNTRETLTWMELKLSNIGWTNDAELFVKMDINLGPQYVWPTAPDASGGTLSFKSESIVLSRVASTASSMGRWQ